MTSTRSRPRLRYIRAGGGPPIVFSHALGCTMRMWDGVASAPLNQRTPSSATTPACHGRSEVVAAPTSMATWSATPFGLIDELDCESVTWVGLSMGGMIGQGLAIAHPERVERLILANTTSRYPDEARQLWTERARIARADGMQALAPLIMSRYFSPMFLASRPTSSRRSDRTSSASIRWDTPHVARLSGRSTIMPRSNASSVRHWSSRAEPMQRRYPPCLR